MMRTILPTLLLAAATGLTACAGSSGGESSDPDARRAAPDAALVADAEAAYSDFVRSEARQLLAGTRRFAAAAAAGEEDRARELYPRVRTHWERIETVAESFGALDPKLDARQADLEPGQEWTGWHRLEKDLWPQRAVDYTPLTAARTDALADRLVADTELLVDRIDELELSVTDIADGSRGLLEEVANGKVTGEEEYWSRTDLYDFQANIDGAAVGYEELRPIVVEADPRLARTLTERFDDVQALLDRHRRGDGFIGYDELGDDQVKELADAVNALAEPLSRLSAVVTP